MLSIWSNSILQGSFSVRHLLVQDTLSILLATKFLELIEKHIIAIFNSHQVARIIHVVTFDWEHLLVHVHRSNLFIHWNTEAERRTNINHRFKANSASQLSDNIIGNWQAEAVLFHLDATTILLVKKHLDQVLLSSLFHARASINNRDNNFIARFSVVRFKNIGSENALSPHKLLWSLARYMLILLKVYILVSKIKLGRVGTLSAHIILFNLLIMSWADILTEDEDWAFSWSVLQCILLHIQQDLFNSHLISLNVVEVLFSILNLDIW